MSRPIVVLVGPPGAGKTTIGRRLAAALDTDFVDTDQLIAEAASQPCSQVLTAVGEEKFRVLEAEAVERALVTPGVVALGGGAVTTERVRDALGGHQVVWVDVSADEGIRRAVADGGRPLLEGDDPAARYRELLDNRLPLYRQVARFKARTDGKNPRQVVADVLCWLDDEKQSAHGSH